MRNFGGDLSAALGFSQWRHNWPIRVLRANMNSCFCGKRAGGFSKLIIYFYALYVQKSVVSACIGL